MDVITVYDDGTILDKKVLDFEPAVLIAKFQAGA